MPADVAFAEVEKQRGKQFDPEAANAFLQIKQQIVQQMQSESRRTCALVPPDGTLRLAQ